MRSRAILRLALYGGINDHRTPPTIHQAGRSPIQLRPAVQEGNGVWCRRSIRPASHMRGLTGRAERRHRDAMRQPERAGAVVGERCLAGGDGGRVIH